MPIDIPLRENVRRILLAQGLTAVGFTRAEPVPDHTSDWVKQGRHAGMEYMARRPAQRADPTQLLKGAQSVICGAVSYPATDARGPIAGYARGEDYHRTLLQALHSGIEQLLQLMPSMRARACVDTAPLSERAFAARAGLGWIGKNTMLLNCTHGPWLLLGSIITDVPFPPDEPTANRCGTCTACIDACPTQALGPTGLDARLCLSYWNIEHRGELAPGISEALQGRVFGCDDCLTACPFPAKSQGGTRVETTSHKAFQARSDLVSPSLDELKARASASFRKNFSTTPLQRVGRARLLRNIEAARQDEGEPVKPKGKAGRPAG
ncbi:MAG: tRNA epoxyqueuosine(34) reductase QueG [Planctomycetota bacterium]